MKERDYRCEAVSIEGLVQQVTVSYLRHGYFHYVTGALKPQQTPSVIDDLIIEKYDIRKCWRYRAQQKARGFANLQYIRFGEFYVIMATDGEHRFKKWERKNLRDIREAPMLVPVMAEPRKFPAKKKKRHSDSQRVFEGYAIAYKQGRYERKTAEERAAYRKALADWQRNKLAGKNLPKPPRGRVNVKLHPTVSIEEQSFERLRAYFLSYATKWPCEKLELEFRAVPYEPYWMVKRQLFDVLCEVNDARKAAGKDQLPYSVVHSMKRKQVYPFGRPEAKEERVA